MVADLARAALRAYELEPGARPIPVGQTNNAVFEIRTDADRRFVLRIHRPEFRAVAHTRSELLFLQRLHEELRETHVAVPRPIPARDGGLVVEVEGRHCDLLSWVDGRVLRPARGLGPAATRLLGEALGRIHNVAAQLEASELELPRWDADGMFTEASPYRPGPFDDSFTREQRELFREVEDRTRAIFARLDRRGDAFGAIHFDFILLNCHFVRRGRRWEVGVLDFDDLGWGYFLYDLCPLLGNLAEFPRYSTMRAAFLAGYRSVRALPRELEAYLPVLMAARHVSTCLWVIGLERTRGGAPPVREHIEYRMGAARACLALG